MAILDFIIIYLPSFLGHKEFRFILPILPLTAVLMGEYYLLLVMRVHPLSISCHPPSISCHPPSISCHPSSIACPSSFHLVSIVLPSHAHRPSISCPSSFHLVLSSFHLMSYSFHHMLSSFSRVHPPSIPCHPPSILCPSSFYPVSSSFYLVSILLLSRVILLPSCVHPPSITPICSSSCLKEWQKHLFMLRNHSMEFSVSFVMI